MRSSGDRWRAAPVGNLMKTLLSLVVVLCAAPAASSSNTWQREPYASAGGQTGDPQRWPEMPEGREVAGPADTRHYTLDGSVMSEQRQAVVDKLIQALRSRLAEEDGINGIDHYGIGGADERSDAYVVTNPAQDRCQCPNKRNGYADMTIPTILLWAALAVAAWYTPVTRHDSSRLLNTDNWSEAVLAQLQNGIELWSASVSGQRSQRTARSPDPGVGSGRGYGQGRGLPRLVGGLGGSPWQWTGAGPQRPRVARQLSRLGSSLRGTISTVTGRLADMFSSWSSGDTDSFSSRDGYGHRYPHGSGHYFSGCSCERSRGLLYLTRLFLYNSYWIPLLGLCLLFAEEVLWWRTDVNNNSVNIGFTGRDHDLPPSWTHYSQQENRHQ